MSDFLLIHGSCHGAWCWDDLIPALEALGHTARAIDLPSHGADKTPVKDVTLDLYARAIIDAIDTPVTLVGHSMAGYPITAAAELAPEKISKLIYLCAYVPKAGMTLGDRRKSAPTQPLIEAIRICDDRISFEIDPTMAAEKFYHDVEPARAAWAVSKLGPQPIAPQETVLAVTETLPRHYIRCLDDRTVPPAFQVTMTQDWPAETVSEMHSSHSPFLSDPIGLAKLLSRVAN
ncbi:MAG: alpha/beta fold hydrolase [Yoonia sp.]|nr:alpha/beta fold hydrolase [Yoonia sp.]